MTTGTNFSSISSASLTRLSGKYKVYPGSFMPAGYIGADDVIPQDDPEYIASDINEAWSNVQAFSSQATSSFTLGKVWTEQQPAVIIQAGINSDTKGYCDCTIMGQSIVFRVDKKYYPGRVKRWLQKVLIGMEWKLNE